MIGLEKLKRVSIIIRTLNEAKHLGELLTAISGQKLVGLEAEIVVIDSGSSDNTIAIAEAHNAKITTIDKSEFSFGRSLNRGCEFSTGDILVFVSGHCVPTDSDWLQNLCQPLLDLRATYTYGGQVGDEDSNWSERRIFAKYFPEKSSIPQDGFFCNNANSAILRSAWADYQFDEELTGLEDMQLAKRLFMDGAKIGYVAEAVVLHHHDESWAQVRRRFEREAIALSEIMPEVQISLIDVFRCVLIGALGDCLSAMRNRATSTSYFGMFLYRWNQYYGSYKGNRGHRVLSREAKARFFYPKTDLIR